MEPAESFIKFLQSSISPIALISGVGLILLTLNHRIGRTIDKSRSIVAELQSGQNGDSEKKKRELGILFKRSRILRLSITSLSFSILASSLIIPVLFMHELIECRFTYFWNYSFPFKYFVHCLFSHTSFYRCDSYLESPRIRG